MPTSASSITDDESSATGSSDVAMAAAVADHRKRKSTTSTTEAERERNRLKYAMSFVLQDVLFLLLVRDTHNAAMFFVFLVGLQQRSEGPQTQKGSNAKDERKRQTVVEAQRRTP